MYSFLIIYTIIVCYLMQKGGSSTRKVSFKFFKVKICFTSDLIWFLVLSCPLIYAFTCRSFEVGTDTRGIYYEIYYRGYAVNQWKPPVYEGLFIQYVKALYQISPHFEFFLFVSCTLMCAIFVGYFIKKRKELNALVGILFFLVWIYAPSLNVLRQVLAVGICFIGLLQMEKEKPIEAGLIFAIAAFVHITSVVMFVFYIPYFLGKQEKWRKRIPVLFFLAPLAVLILFEVVVKIPLFSKFSDKVQAFSFSNMNMKFFMFPLLMLPIIILFWNKLVKISAFNYIHLCGTIMIYTAIFLSGYLWYAYRMMYFFLPSEAVILGKIGNCCKNKTERRIINTYIVVVLILSFYFIYVWRDTDGIYPYVLNS